MNIFKISYVTTLPKIGNAPRVIISGDEIKKYRVEFKEFNGHILSSGYCSTNQTIIANVKQWYVNWHVLIYDENNVLVHQDLFNPTNKTVFIKIDAWALGDNIAWIPYVEEFRLKHRCNIICSTFYNYLFVDSYPDILFVAPNTVIENVYAQYYIGAVTEPDIIYSPVSTTNTNLQEVASKTLGLNHQEIRPTLEKSFSHYPISKGKYVTLSEFGSTQAKGWKYEGGWQEVVNFLVSNGYEVVVISKEPTSLKNIIDKTGDIPLIERIVDILGAEFHLGISSGLSWLSWALNKHVVMISDVTPTWHEFGSSITRICANNLDKINYDAEFHTEPKNVIVSLSYLIQK